MSISAGVNLTTLASLLSACANPPVITSTGGVNSCAGGWMGMFANNIQISVCTATNNALTLPANPDKGTTYTVRNDGAFFAQIFPYAACTVAANGFVLAQATIDGQAAGVEAYVAGNGGVKTFTAISPTAWVTTYTNGVKPVFNMILANTITGATNGTLSRAHNNSLIQLNLAAGFIVALPAVATSAGIDYTFVCQAVGGAYVITPATSVMRGALPLYIADTHAGATPTDILKAAAASYTHTTTAVIGDQSRVWSDGTSWYCSGFTQAAAGFS